MARRKRVCYKTTDTACPIFLVCIQLFFWHWTLERASTPSTISAKRFIILSLSTMPARTNELISTLHSILTQTLLPSRIIINFSNETDYPVDEVLANTSAIFSNLPRNNRPALTFQACSGHWRSSAKLLGALKYLRQEASSNKSLAYDDEPYVVYADDDTIYPGRWLESLVAGSYKKPGCAIGL